MEGRPQAMSPVRHLHEHRVASQSLEQSCRAPFRPQESHSDHTSEGMRASHNHAFDRGVKEVSGYTAMNALQSAKNPQATAENEHKLPRYRGLRLVPRETALHRSDTF